MTLAAIGVVTLLCMWIYWPGLAGPFVFDDVQNIVEAYVADPDLQSLIYSMTHNTSGAMGRGVSALSFQLTSLQFGLDPWGFKFHNLLLHLLNGLLFFRLTSLLLPLLEPRLDPRRNMLIAGVVCSFWLLHPLQVSTVLYAVQRMAQLAATFSLLALLAYVKARMRAHADLQYYLLAWGAFPLCMLLAVLSKETGVLIPFYVLALELFVFRLTLRDLRRQGHAALLLSVFVFLPLLVGGLYFVTHVERFADYSSRTFTLYERLLTQLHVVFTYARLILLPRLKAMGLYHDDFPITHSLDASTVALLLLLAGVCGLIWFSRRRAPVLAFGLAWFLVSHLLESTVIPLEMMFEHRNYLAAFGLLLPPLYYAFFHMPFRVPQYFALAYLGVLMFQTHSRVQEWTSEGTLTYVAVADHPESTRARSFLANYYFNNDMDAEAVEQLQVARQLSPDNAGATLHELTYRCLTGARDEALLQEAEARLRNYPASPYALNGLENLVAFRARGTCDVLSVEDLEKLVEAALAMPNNTRYEAFYGYLVRFRGLLAFMQGRYAEGVINFRLAHEHVGMTGILAELIRNQISFQRLDDAEDTLDYFRELNEASFGVDSHTIEELSVELAAARSGNAQEQLDPAPQAGGAATRP